MTESIFSLSSSSECNYTTICFDELLALLTPKQKIVIEMIYWQGKSEKEIAKYPRRFTMCDSEIQKGPWRNSKGILSVKNCLCPKLTIINS